MDVVVKLDCNADDKYLREEHVFLETRIDDIVKNKIDNREYRFIQLKN